VRQGPNEEVNFWEGTKIMLDSGITQPSKSSFLAPVVMVRRKDNSWRICLDYRDLKKITIKDKFLNY
jgi:hypothetical protein